jgi:carboxy-cis,cis-muconate cyclase
LTINHRICYTTTWAKEPSLSSWSIGESYDTLQHLNTVPISERHLFSSRNLIKRSTFLAATSSYLQITPDSKRLYSAGGPTGEVHSLAVDGSIGIKLQELLYVEPDELAQADKTRVALRYGSHGIDINLATKQAFVPHLGSNSIYMYDVLANGGLNLVNKAESFGNGKDGPRHVIFSEDGTTLYTVTEHSGFFALFTSFDD